MGVLSEGVNEEGGEEGEEYETACEVYEIAGEGVGGEEFGGVAESFEREGGEPDFVGGESAHLLFV